MAKLNVSIVDVETMEPLNGVTICIKNRAGYTAYDKCKVTGPPSYIDGTTFFPGLPDGLTWDITVTKSGYKSLKFAEILSGDVVLDLKMEKTAFNGIGILILLGLALLVLSGD